MHFTCHFIENAVSVTGSDAYIVHRDAGAAMKYEIRGIPGGPMAATLPVQRLRAGLGQPRMDLGRRCHSLLTGKSQPGAEGTQLIR